MLLGVVVSQGVPGLEYFPADNACMLNVQMYLNVSLGFTLVECFATGETVELAILTSCDHGLDQSVQI